MLATSDAKLRALQEQLLEARQTVTSAVITRLRAVSVLQSRIRELNARVVDHKQALTAQANAVAELAHVEAMPAAYKACLQEVVRRRTFEKLYVAEVEAAADKLSRLRASETYAREAFLRRHGRHLPKNLVRGLNDRPPHVDILTRPFDTALPAIDPASIEPSDSPVSSDIEEQSAVSNGPDDISRENILRLQHENAKLKAQLASFAAFCVAGDSAVKLRRASTPMVGNSDHTNAEEMASPRTLRDLSLQICEKVAMLSQEAQDDEKVLSGCFQGRCRECLRCYVD
jgi:autophagy-related protein 11